MLYEATAPDRLIDFIAASNIHDSTKIGAIATSLAVSSSLEEGVN